MPKELPLNPLWKSLGAVFETKRGWRIPAHFGDPKKEYEAARKRAGLFDRSSRGKIRVTGADRIDFLHRILSQDVRGLKPGEVSPAALLSAQGRMLAYFHVTVAADWVLLDFEQGLAKKTMEEIQHYVVTDDVALEDVTESLVLISLQGPKSETLGLPAHPSDGTTREPEILAGLPMIRRTHTGEKVYDLILEKKSAPSLVQRILEKGRGIGLEPVGMEAAEWLRIEAGTPRYGIDMDESVTLPETGLEKIAASETKGCYPGQEVVARMITYSGHPRKLMGLLFPKGELPAAGGRILAGDREIGRVTSVCISPALGKGIGMGYLAKGYFEGEDRGLEVETTRGKIQARVTSLPFRLP